MDGLRSLVTKAADYSLHSGCLGAPSCQQRSLQSPESFVVSEETDPYASVSKGDWR